MMAATMFAQDRSRCRWQRSLNIHYYFLFARIWDHWLQNRAIG